MTIYESIKEKLKNDGYYIEEQTYNKYDFKTYHVVRDSGNNTKSNCCQIAGNICKELVREEKATLKTASANTVCLNFIPKRLSNNKVLFETYI